MSSNRVLFAIFLMASAMFTYVSVNALLRICDQPYHPIQVLFFRYAFSLLPCLFFAGPSLLRQRKAPVIQYAFRGFASAASLGALFASIYLLPYANATVLMFVATLFMIALSKPLLGEKIHKEQWFAVVLGFVGVVIMANPSGHLNIWGVALGVFSAFIEAILLLHGRKLTRQDDSITIVFYGSVFALLAVSCGIGFVWKTPTLKDIILLGIFGMGGAIGQVLQTLASKQATAGTLAPVIYTAAIWSLLWGTFVFHEAITKELLIGGGIIILCGLWVVYSERKNQSIEEAIDIAH